ncbi:phosphopantetheine-binding protein [Nonomuraea sp. B12E4]|uniref:phosphopantetheine-binding protein n=1 Tax=Nonomuraea sp. B12E4 TaxID=3153564 RepID=UPI00325D35EE
MDEIQEMVANIAGKCLGMGAGELGPDDDLRAVGLTSLRMVELMTELEERLSIEFPDEIIEVGTFGSVRSLADSVRRLAS